MGIRMPVDAKETKKLWKENSSLDLAVTISIHWEGNMHMDRDFGSHWLQKQIILPEVDDGTICQCVAAMTSLQQEKGAPSGSK
jgi:hypothetical protein